ncbi:hypothetical protein BHM03_00052928 [Ensete ventricosum]|uniref:Uncharacterized protein n=1 Tax=Ensete ventricosum TaxID=4639 RepID=A0A445MLV9_ENSVE|nr:hypothetical protein BHM03_00052928 [Ensete ventricosum]
MRATLSLQYLTRCSRLLSKVLQAGWPIVFSSAMSPVACCQGCCRLVGPSRPLCHIANCLLCPADRLGFRIFQLTLSKPGRHPTYVRLGDTVTWPRWGCRVLVLVGRLLLATSFSPLCRNPFRYAPMGRTWNGL